MTTPFNPYHAWLGIPPDQQPPNHYRLLGLELFEDDADVISSAADKQMAHLRSFQTGQHGTLTQKLLNEVATAKLCLLKPDKKAAYDARLRAALEEKTPSSDYAAIKDIVSQSKSPVSASAPSKSMSTRTIAMACGGAAVLVVLVLVFIFSGKRNTEVAKQESSIAVQKQGPAKETPKAVQEPAKPTPLFEPSPPSKKVEPVKEQPKPTEVAQAVIPTPPVDPSKLLVNSIGMKLVLIPAGEFEMGTTEEEFKQLEQEAANQAALGAGFRGRVRTESPRHRVVITKPFYIGAFEVTQGEYQQVSGKTAEQNKSQYPVNQVSWEDAVAFCQRLSASPQEIAERRIYRLPSEAEWERACRAGTTTPYYFGDAPAKLDEYTWFQAKTIQPVGQKKPNLWGIYDICGNVWEWCSDWQGPDYYRLSPLQDPAGPPSGTFRVHRGAGCGGSNDRPLFYRSAFRSWAAPTSRRDDIGFRVVCEIVAPGAKPQLAQQPNQSQPTSSTASAKQPVQQEPSEKKKLPVPDEAAREKAVKLVRETFKDELDKAKNPDDKKALARRLLQQATETKDDPPGQYALLEVARDIAIEAGDGGLSFDAVDKMGELFQIDPFVMKEEILSGFAKKARSPAGHRAISERALVVMDEAMTANNFEAAAILGKLASAEGLKSRDKELAQQARSRMKDVEQAKKAFAEVEDAAKTLKAKPDDPDANATVGRYTCFVKGDWGIGLPMLVKGSGTALKDLAAKDLGHPTKPEERVTLADGWYDRAETERGAVKKNIQLRAAHWYWLAAPDLTGLEQTKVERRMKALAGLVANLPVPKQITNKIDGSVLVLIPAGKFLMGAEKFPVDLPACYLGMYLVTNAQYKKFVDATKHRPPGSFARGVYSEDNADHPVLGMAWDDAKAYCDWAGLRLPTELEWQKGARGTDGREYPWGNEWDPKNCRTNEPLGSVGVFSYPEGRSPFGLYQMVGSANQWCADWHNTASYERYKRGDFSPPTVSSDNPPLRLLYGGIQGGPPLHVVYRCTNYHLYPSEYRTGIVGLRVAKSVIP